MAALWLLLRLLVGAAWLRDVAGFVSAVCKHTVRDPVCKPMEGRLYFVSDNCNVTAIPELVSHLKELCAEYRRRLRKKMLPDLVVDPIPRPLVPRKLIPDIQVENDVFVIYSRSEVSQSQGLDQVQEYVSMARAQQFNNLSLICATGNPDNPYYLAYGSLRECSFNENEITRTGDETEVFATYFYGVDVNQAGSRSLMSRFHSKEQDLVSAPAFCINYNQVVGRESYWFAASCVCRGRAACQLALRPGRTCTFHQSMLGSAVEGGVYNFSAEDNLGAFAAVTTDLTGLRDAPCMESAVLYRNKRNGEEKFMSLEYSPATVNRSKWPTTSTKLRATVIKEFKQPYDIGLRVDFLENLFHLTKQTRRLRLRAGVHRLTRQCMNFVASDGHCFTILTVGPEGRLAEGEPRASSDHIRMYRMPRGISTWSAVAERTTGRILYLLECRGALCDRGLLDGRHLTAIATQHGVLCNHGAANGVRHDRRRDRGGTTWNPRLRPTPFLHCAMSVMVRGSERAYHYFTPMRDQFTAAERARMPAFGEQFEVERQMEGYFRSNNDIVRSGENICMTLRMGESRARLAACICTARLGERCNTFERLLQDVGFGTVFQRLTDGTALVPNLEAVKSCVNADEIRDDEVTIDDPMVFFDLSPDSMCLWHRRPDVDHHKRHELFTHRASDPYPNIGNAEEPPFHDNRSWHFHFRANRIRQQEVNALSGVLCSLQSSGMESLEQGCKCHFYSNQNSLVCCCDWRFKQGLQANRNGDHRFLLQSALVS